MNTRRWIWFGPTGQKVELTFTLVDGIAHVPENDLEQALRDAGYTRANPDPVERAWLARRKAARSTLQDALNRRGR